MRRDRRQRTLQRAVPALLALFCGGSACKSEVIVLDACQKDRECGEGYRCDHLRCIPDPSALVSSSSSASSSGGAESASSTSSVSASVTTGEPQECAGPTCVECFFSECAAAACAGPHAACQADLDCSALFACFAACDKNDAACFDACAQMSSGSDLLTELALCIECSPGPCFSACDLDVDCPK